MALPPPPYIPTVALQQIPIRHRWDEEDPYSAIGKPREETMTLLARMSDRAMIAYSIGCAEWVVFRFGALCPDPRPADFLEACWAFEMDKSFESPPESEEEEWQGPIRGPIDLALMTVLNTYYTTEDRAGEIEGAFGDRIRYSVDGEVRDLGAGESAFTPKGAVHGFSNPFPQFCRALVVLSPDIGAQYFRDIVSVLGTGGPPDRARLLQVMERYGLKPAVPAEPLPRS